MPAEIKRDDRLMRHTLLLFMVGCGPSIVSTTPRSVTVDGVNESTMAKATEMAQAECEKNGRDAELVSTDDMARGFATKAVTFKCVDPAETARAPIAQPAVAQPASNERKTVTGTQPLNCVITAPDIGECWVSAETCTSNAAGATCEQRNAGSCFNATKTLDGTKATVCAVSISDCEARLKTYAENPDYTVTKCGIYRVGQ